MSETVPPPPPLNRANGTLSPSSAGNEQAWFAVRVAPAVVATVVRKAVGDVQGVIRLANDAPSPRFWKKRGRTSYAREGVRIAVQDGQASVAVHLVLGRSQNLHTVGSAVQEAVTRAVESLVGMKVESVDIFVQDVD